MPLPKSYGVERGWSVQNKPLFEDTTPDPFAIPAVTEAGLNQPVTSAAVVVTGTNVPAPLKVTNALVSIDGGPFGAGPPVVQPGAQIRLQRQSSPAPSTPVTAVLEVGPVAAIWTITTAAEAAYTPSLDFSDPRNSQFAPVFNRNP
ncbi:hypothetical protein [Phenylobacterium sp. 58.2.17]|uniref:hypothetical protein n=1 Tax=Phenylobacterium sp. 58.2.17 TaxID=2969306 RepID=UPI002263FF42|nr:hypothetical protein [Phenylobacterium sp. 58.2.17]MCX7586530.1 hypothetical protein [Phenylobacterium sp. 58.2.17]